MPLNNRQNHRTTSNIPRNGTNPKSSWASGDIIKLETLFASPPAITVQPPKLISFSKLSNIIKFFNTVTFGLYHICAHSPYFSYILCLSRILFRLFIPVFFPPTLSHTHTCILTHMHTHAHIHILPANPDI